MPVTRSQHDPIFDALGNPVRREIVRLLVPGPRPVGKIADELPVSRPAVSKHLRVLEKAQLVTSEHKGNMTVVRLNPTGFAAARAWLESFWDEALAEYARIAAATAPNATTKTTRTTKKKGKR